MYHVKLKYIIPNSFYDKIFAMYFICVYSDNSVTETYYNQYSYQ